MMFINPLSMKRTKTKTLISAVLGALFFALAAFSQTPPPNDNYSNSITLTGMDITFSGTLAGATLEDSQEIMAYIYFYGALSTGVTESVWWNWTAPTDTVLTLEVSQQEPIYTNSPDGIVVYSATNGSSSPAGLVMPALGVGPNVSFFLPGVVSIPVTGGSNYQIQLLGGTSGNYSIHLVATNTPVIVTQPRSQTVYSNASALFYVMYAGVGQSNFTFQWYFNGTNLPNETAPMLALTNIDSTMAGDYTVAVSNSAGATMSAPATLTVSQSNFPVLLTAVGFAATNCYAVPGGEFLSDAFCFTVNGELGRSYRLQSSIDLTTWSAENDYRLAPGSFQGATSIFFQTNVSQLLASPTYTYPRFFRVAPYVTNDPDTEICINNLRQIRIAKMLWQRDYNPAIFATPFTDEITPYFPHQTLPVCPEDTNQTFATSYSVNNLQTFPLCLVVPTNHVLVEPR